MNPLLFLVFLDLETVRVVVGLDPNGDVVVNEFLRGFTLKIKL